jgi:hypothetical protein
MIKYIMYNVQDYSVLYNNVVQPVMCEDWYFTHTGKTFEWSHQFSNGGERFYHKNSLTPPLYIKVHVSKQAVTGRVYEQLGYI